MLLRGIDIGPDLLVRIARALRDAGLDLAAWQDPISYWLLHGLLWKD